MTSETAIGAEWSEASCKSARGRAFQGKGTAKFVEYASEFQDYGLTDASK